MWLLRCGKRDGAPHVVNTDGAGSYRPIRTV